MSNVWNPWEDVLLSDSEDEDSELRRIYNGHEALWFVVDGNLAKEPPRLFEALNIIKNAYLSGLITNNRDIMGIMFVNTAKCPMPLEAAYVDVVLPAGCAIFLSLHQLTKPIVEHLLQFIAGLPETFERDYGVADDQASFSATIRVSIDLMEKCGRKLNMGHIIYMTDRESPHEANSLEHQWALQKAAYLNDKFIEFHVIPMVNDFNYDTFYKEFISLTNGMDIESFQKPDESLQREILEDRKLKQDIMRRSLGHFKFWLGANLEIAAQYYNYFQRRIYPKKVLIMRKDNTVVKQRRSVIVRKIDDNPEDQLLQERQIKVTDGWYRIQIGSEEMRLTTEQLNHIRNMHRPGMKLLGFKDKAVMDNILYSRPSHFMYPDEESITGSKRLFRALWERCLHRDKIAVCIFLAKRNSKPRYVALVPVEATKLTNDSQPSQSYQALLSGDGFKIVYLPCMNHIRHIDWNGWNSIANTVEPGDVQLFKNIARKLRIEYQPGLINDPLLSKLQADLLALALNIEAESEVTTMPNTDIQDKRIEHLLPEYERIFNAESDEVSSQQGKRPSQNFAQHDNPAKRLKDPAPTEESLKSYTTVTDLVKENSLERCNISALRFILEEHFNTKMRTTAKKADLIEKIIELVNTNTN